jgi:hypothetical protein
MRAEASLYLSRSMAYRREGVLMLCRAWSIGVELAQMTRQAVLASVSKMASRLDAYAASVLKG